jgi:hypothetical protein
MSIPKTTGANQMTYKIEVDVLEAVQDFYPGLPLDDAKQIAESIVDNWDYTNMFNGIADDISWYADSHDIDLNGKDGVEEESDNIYAINSPKSTLFP